jgi:catechol 2,3-dioxygenase-like lactoylglutathione lyase family enzyme
MILGLDHVAIPMPAGREEEAVAFYAGILGLQELEKPPLLGTRGGVWFRVADGRQLHLQSESQFTPLERPHPAFVCDVDQVGRVIALDWDDAIPHRRRGYAKDPFGNRIEFIEPAPSAKPNLA